MHGGSRPGAGRPKGSRNKRTLLLEEGAKKATAGGTTPLDYLLDIMRDEGQPFDLRFEAAKAAAPYCHPKLAATHVTEGEGHLTHEQWVRRLADQIGIEQQQEAPAFDTSI